MICNDDKCKLAIKYPNTDANIACDEECYFKYMGTKKDIEVPVLNKKNIINIIAKHKGKRKR